MKIVAFAASNSSHSINLVLATHAAGLVPGASVGVLDLNDYEMPLFSEDRENEHGHPEQARYFIDRMAEADALITSYAEHNGSFSAAYKNVVDWASRVDRSVFQGKPTLMLATSTGRGGGGDVLAHAATLAPTFGAQLVTTLSVPSFKRNFDVSSNRFTNPVIAADLEQAVLSLANVVATANKPASVEFGMTQPG